MAYSSTCRRLHMLHLACAAAVLIAAPANAYGGRKVLESMSTGVLPAAAFSRACKTANVFQAQQ